MTSLFDDITQFDESFLANRREAAAVAHKRVQDRVGSYLKIAKTSEEYDARLNFVSDDIRQIVAEVSEEFSVDHDKLADAIDDALKGDGVTDINEELADAPSAVGTKASANREDASQPDITCPRCSGEGKLASGTVCPRCDGNGKAYSDKNTQSNSHKAGGHKLDCSCGFCKNKGNLPGRIDQKEQEDKDASEPHDDDDSGEEKESSIHVAEIPQGAPSLSCPHCGHPLDRMETGVPCPNCGQEPINADFQGQMDNLLPGQAPGQYTRGLNNEPYDPRQGATKEADAPHDGGGATKTVSLPTGKGDAVGYGASPEIDKKTWKPNALNDNGNLKPVDAEMSGSPVPTKTQDLVDDKPDYEGDFLRDTGAVTTQQDLPSADDTGQSTERNISQEGQSGTWTEGQNDAVTPQVFASADPDVNPLKAILESGFATDNQVESAIREFRSE